MNVAMLGERNVERFGSYPALVFADDERTNDEQLGMAARAGGGLAALGVGPGDRVAVILANSMEVSVAYGAILRVGGVVVPMIFLLAAPEVTHILADSGAKAIFTSPEFLGTVLAAVEPLEEPPVVIVVGEAPEGTMPYAELLAAEAVPVTDRSPGDVAVISYTSGTTGHPKGVMLTHANLLFQAENTSQVSSLRDGDVTMSCLPLAHLFGLGSALVVQLYKVRNVIMDWFTPAGVFETVQRHGVNATALVPTMVSMMLADPAFDDVDWSSLNYVVIGAAPLPTEVSQAFERRTGARVLQGYGLTETSPTVSLLRLDDPSNGSAGRPVPNVDVEIRDDDGRALPAGEPGEICVRGPNVMAGYHGLPDATAEAIRDGWFLTGDIGYLDAGGYLFITDRKKDLIIRGGFNIYPSDVEDALHQHPAVLEAGVVGTPDPTMGEEVVAYVVLKPGSDATPDELHAHCAEHLARYKTPKHVVLVDSLPKNAIGKILRKDLRERARAGVTA